MAKKDVFLMSKIKWMNLFNFSISTYVVEGNSPILKRRECQSDIFVLYMLEQTYLFYGARETPFQILLTDTPPTPQVGKFYQVSVFN